MIHDGFIYLATLMLLAAILVNLPVYLRGKGAQTFFKFAPPIVLIYLGMMLLCTMKVWDLQDTSAVYVAIKNPLLYAMLFLMLLRCDLKKIIKLGPKMLIGFFAASLSICTGFIVSYAIFHKMLGPDSWKALEDAVAAAKDVVAKADASQSEIDAAVNGIIDALGSLEYGVQTLHLETAIEAAEAILADADNYESVDALKAAADAGKAVLAKADATQAEIDAAADAVLAEMSKLAENADRASLKKLADAAEKLTDGNYTSDSIAKLNDAISKAKDALENGDEAAIAGAYEELIDAITNLEMKGNKAALKAMLEKAAAILADTDAYVASTIDGLATVKADAQNVYDNADAVQSEINAAVKSLTLKIAAARLLGDVNGDGAVTTSDSVSVLAASAELTSLDADATASADVNGDGVADTLDAAVILQTAAEK